GRPRLGPPLAGIGKIVCIGLNYTDHAREVGLPLPSEPLLFVNANSAISGPNDPILRPPGGVKRDYEVELGGVIGRCPRPVGEGGDTKNMIFGVRHLVSYVSRFMSLRAGDIISTGTPAGVAHGMKPPRYLQPGDVVEMGITGLGVQKNKIVGR